MINSPTHLLISLALVFLLCLVTACKKEYTVHISFEVQINGEPMQFGKPYSSPNGDGSYEVNDFKFYLSNIQLVSGGQHKDFIESDSYHLLTFPEDNRCTFSITGVPKEEYKGINFSIGVDDEGTFSKGYPGDLDPTNQMAWNWTQGYKFILFEGLYTPGSNDEKIPLVYHVGFSENKKDLVFDLDSFTDIRFIVHLNQLFDNPNLIDFHTHPRILFNKEHSAMISENYAESFIELRY